MCSAQKMAVAMDGGGSSLVHGHGYWKLGSATVAKGAGANRVVPAVEVAGAGCHSIVGPGCEQAWAQWMLRAQLRSAAALAGATAAVTQGSVVARARLVQVAVEARVTQGFAMGRRI